MSYFLSSQKLTLNSPASLSNEEARHILLSRRMKINDSVEIQDIDGKRYAGKILKIGKNTLEFMPEKELSVPKELEIRITLFQSYINEKALDIIFQKATELGAASITLFNSQNTATKLSADLFQKKFERWNKILWEAAKQSGRGTIPELQFIPNINGVAIVAEHFDGFLILDASGAVDWKWKTENCKFFGLLIGPEGGLTSTELSQLQSISNSQLVSISPFTLRAETAAIASLAIMSQ